MRRPFGSVALLITSPALLAFPRFMVARWHPWRLSADLPVLALSLATSLTLLLAGTIRGTIAGPMIRRGTVQTELLPETTSNFSVRLLEGRTALSTVTFAFGTFLPTKFSSVPVFAKICAVSFLAFTLSLSTLSLPIFPTSSTATLVLVAAILTISARTAFGAALALVLPASTAVHSPDLGCVFMLGQIAFFATPNLIHQDLMDSFHRQFLPMDLFGFIHLIELFTMFTVSRQGIHKRFLCPIGCNRHGLLKQKTPFKHACSPFLK